MERGIRLDWETKEYVVRCGRCRLAAVSRKREALVLFLGKLRSQGWVLGLDRCFCPAHRRERK